jgi:fructose-bisphosphate aldolase class I
MNIQILKQTALKMVPPGKGILAIDESMGSIKKRFDSVGVECTEENRRSYRELLITATGMEEYIGGMILFDETIRQKTEDGKTFVSVLEEKGIVPGIKVDMGAKEMALHPGEKVTEGLDCLRERLAEYKEMGARFAKWRAVISIGKGFPTDACIKANAHALSRYAALCQEADLVPMVEPEVLMDGDHSLDRCYEVTAETLQAVFKELAEMGVDPEGAILKTNMVLPGSESAGEVDYKAVAEETVQCLKENVPENIAGIVFLSGGQSEKEATVHLNDMHKMFRNLPWPLSFSYGRAIQAPALKIWGADQGNIKEAQDVLVKRSRLNGLASKGEYDESMED